jgi:NhaA family Na+:H+ antiporter
VAVPIFAFFSAGVAIGGLDGLAAAFGDAAAVGVVAGLVLGKPVGIVGTTWLIAKFTRARLDPSLKWIDLVGMAVLAGIGFTVSLLVAELSFGLSSAHNDHAKVAILTASLLAAVLASGLLLARNRRYRRIEAEEQLDADQDGIPDVYQQDGQ